MPRWLKSAQENRKDSNDNRLICLIEERLSNESYADIEIIANQGGRLAVTKVN
jgi:hypothetical protein